MSRGCLQNKKATFSFYPVFVDAPFQQWGLDIVGTINPTYSLVHKYILAATYCFTIWVELVPFHVVNTSQVMSFLETNYTITCFGISE